MQKYDFSQMLEWLYSHVKKCRFADLSITVRIHDGKVSLVETTCTEKFKGTTINHCINHQGNAQDGK